MRRTITEAELALALQEVVHDMEVSAIRGLYTASAHVLSQSASRVSADEAALRGSAYLRTWSGDNTELPASEPSSKKELPNEMSCVEIGFSNPRAAAVHEQVFERQSQSGGAKFLERALLEESENMLRLIAEEME